MPTQKIRLTDKDWDVNTRAWSCDPLAMEHTVILELVDENGRTVMPSQWSRSADSPFIRWLPTTTPPDVLLVLFQIKVPSKDDLAPRWQKLNILIPLIIAIVAPLITYMITRPTGGVGGANSWGSLSGLTAAESFADGAPAADMKKLKGRWRVRMYSYGANDSLIPYMVDGEVYPDEIANCSVKGSLVSFETLHESGENANLWGEGRVSTNDYMTLIIWSDRETYQRDIVGVNLVKLKRNHHPDSALKLVGVRYGVGNDGNIQRGYITYVKEQ